MDCIENQTVLRFCRQPFVHHVYVTFTKQGTRQRDARDKPDVTQRPETGDRLALAPTEESVRHPLRKNVTVTQVAMRHRTRDVV